MHFLCECPCYAEIRDEMMSKMIDNVPDIYNLDLRERFVKIMMCPSIVAKYLIKAWGKRHKVLYVNLLNEQLHYNLWLYDVVCIVYLYFLAVLHYPMSFAPSNNGT